MNKTVLTDSRVNDLLNEIATCDDVQRTKLIVAVLVQAMVEQDAGMSDDVFLGHVCDFARQVAAKTRLYIQVAREEGQNIQ